MADDLFRDINAKSQEVSNIYRGKSKSNVPSKEAIPLKDLKPLAQTPTQGIGNQFLNGTAPEQIEEPLPIDQPPAPEVNIEDVIQNYKDTLVTNGFQDNDDNLQSFVEQNPDPNNISDFTGLRPANDNVVLPGASDSVKKHTLKSSVMQLLSGVLKPLEIIGEGFSRWEAAKVAVIQNLGLKGVIGTAKPLAKAITGTAKSDIEKEGTLKQSEMPELGDFFRELGIPEGLSATLGLVADVATDAVIPGAAIAKGLGKLQDKSVVGIAKALEASGNKAAGDLGEKVLKFKSDQNVKIITDFLKGKSRYDIGDNPIEFKKAMRAARGEANYAVEESNDVARRLKDSIEVNKYAPDVVDNALKGSLSDLAKLDPATQTFVKQGRKNIDNLSKQIKDRLDNIISEEQITPELSKRLDPDQLEDLRTLSSTIASNQGTYTRRYFQSNILKDKFVPDEALKAKAIKALGDSADYKPKDAEELLSRLIKGETTLVRKKGGFVKANTSALQHRLDLPDEVLDYLGVIKDPAFNLSQTSFDLAHLNQKLSIFEKMKEIGYFSKNATKEFSVRVPKGEGVEFGSVGGMFTSPEIADLLKFEKSQKQFLDEKLYDVFNAYKGAKVTLSPKGHGHNIIGNIPFSIIANTSPLQYAGEAKNTLEMLRNVVKVKAGKLPITHPDYVEYLDYIKKGFIKNEFINNDSIKWLEEMAANPFKPKDVSQGPFKKLWEGAKRFGKQSGDLLAQEDMFYKIHNYRVNTKIKKMTPEAATDEVYKWFVNAPEASKLADVLRNTTAGVMLANPYFTFRSEAHRIMMNAMKENNRTRLTLGLLMGSRASFNAAIMGAMGLGLKDIGETFLSRPELVAETIMNPLDKEGRFDLNSKYIDPFNTQGMFAPLLALQGATGVNVYDWLLDFTNFNPDFGYQNLLTDAIAPTVTGIDKYKREIGLLDRAKILAKNVLPSSFGIDVPKGVQALAEDDNPEAIRRAARFVGIDLEKRNPDYLKTKLNTRLKNTIKSGGDVEPIIRAINTIGFDGQAMADRIFNKKDKTPPTKEKDKAFDAFLETIKEPKR